MGDFNARTGELICDSSSEERSEPWEEEDSVEELLNIERKSEDKVVDSTGRRLINFCNQNNLTILNGRTRGDQSGELTFLAIKGQAWWTTS